MPFGGGRTQTLPVSGLTWDVNLTVPAGFRIDVTDNPAGIGLIMKNIIMALGGG